MTNTLRSAPTWLLSVLVVGLGALLRLYDFDVAWFGFDQIRFMSDARRILAGELNVAGPDAGGLDILGPLYSYAIAPLLLVRDAPDLVGLFGAVCDVVACWFAFDAALRLTGRAGAIASGATYAAAPVVVLGTRMIWNPGLLSSVVMLGWWMVVRYAETPSTGRFVRVALVAGVLPALHATGVFHAIGLILAAIASSRIGWRTLMLALGAASLPLLPTLTRLRNSSGLTGLSARLTAPGELPELLAGLDRIVLSFPVGAAGGHFSGALSVTLLHVQAVLAVIGLATIFARTLRYRPVFVGAAISLLTLFGSTVFYSQPLAWHHFMAAVAPSTLLIAPVVQRRSNPTAWAALVVVLAGLHSPFVYTLGRKAKATGVIQVDSDKLYLRIPPATVTSLTVREMRYTGSALRKIVPDGATALMVAHGLRGELWRETGAEYLPSTTVPELPWGTEFILMGSGARPLRKDARVIDDRVCAFAAQPGVVWHVHADTPRAEWAQPEYDDGDWISVTLPRRLPTASHTPVPPLAPWRSASLAFRGRVQSPSQSQRRLWSVSLHTTAGFDTAVDTMYVNGEAVMPLKERTALTSLYRNREWLFDLSPALRLGDNVVAFSVKGNTTLFDVDVFEVLCSDDEWYY